MKLEKKRILKEDGRYLLFYHSEATATPQQTQAFAEVTAEAEPITAPATPASGEAPGQENADV